MARSPDAKSPEAFRTISEVSQWLGTPAHVLRFWESRFPQIKPVKRAGGRRYYRPADMMLLGGIKRLLHDDGITIKGVRKILREKGVKYVASLSAERIEGYEVASASDQNGAEAPPSPIEAILATTTPPPDDSGPLDSPAGDTASDQATDPAIADDAVPAAGEESPPATGMSDDSPHPETAVESISAPRAAADSESTFATGDSPDAAQGDPNDQDARIVVLYQRLAALRDRVAASIGQA